MRTPSFRLALNSVMLMNLDCVRHHSIIKDFNLSWYKGDKKRIVVKSTKEGCNWFISVSRIPDGQTFKLKLLNQNHSCCGVNKSDNNDASVKWVTMLVVGDARENPYITPKEMMNLVDKKFSIKLSYLKAWRAKERVKEIIFENIENSYNLVPSLKRELIARNPGSHVDFLLEGDMAFQRMFVSFKVCIQGFKLGCRPFFGCGWLSFVEQVPWDFVVGYCL